MTSLPKLVTAIADRFPSAQFPEECWLRRAFDRGPHYLPDIEAAFLVAQGTGEYEAIVDRAARQHPRHSTESDERVQDVLTEAAAFAWARERMGWLIQLSDDGPGRDFDGVLGFGGEAKSLHPPRGAQYQRSWAGSVDGGAPAGLVAKLDGHMQKAAVQLAGPHGRDSGFLFVNVLGFADLGQFVSRDLIVEGLLGWASSRLAAFPSIRYIAITSNYRWQTAAYSQSVLDVKLTSEVAYEPEWLPCG